MKTLDTAIETHMARGQAAERDGTISRTQTASGKAPASSIGYAHSCRQSAYRSDTCQPVINRVVLHAQITRARVTIPRVRRDHTGMVEDSTDPPAQGR